MKKAAASKNVWLTGEPSMDEVVSDPIVRQLMIRDGVTPAALHAVVAQAKSHFEAKTHFSARSATRARSPQGSAADCQAA